MQLCSSASPSQATAVLCLTAVLFSSLFCPSNAGLFNTAAEPEQLVQCINDKHSPQQGTTWENAMADVPASFRAAGVWWSAKPQQIPLTVVTQLSVNRLTQLWAQCKSWPGPLSAAVHLSIQQSQVGPLSLRNEQTVKKAVRSILDFHAASEKEPACQLDIILVYELYTDKQAILLYPVNQLRNLARLQARTELIGLMDVDMLVSSKLTKSMLVPEVSAIMIDTCRKNTVYVIPAFETYGTMQEAADQADKLVRQSKTFLVRSVASRVIAPFDARRFSLGHNTTNYKEWYSTEKQYEVSYSARYEPWMVVNRKAVPWHDVRFRGYGQNKIVHVAHVNASGFKFVVHPSAFIIHRAHEITAARTQLLMDKKVYDKATRLKRQLPLDTVYGHSKLLWESAKRDMDSGLFRPVVDPATEYCLSRLSWWNAWSL
ncbi:hypothetical protein CEUSTIGMA_g10822.t1 [Chlamydomonas eustigma]|uniref:Glycosyltransferase-like protein LARGE2 n=1 Tax=Chlamydomonas eustigma TaxID=1157962 RepID=A0A250XJZ9_9CHLO|nr:hypothetical protein CEUSTIGMA_g10822.t1 [Chlamydomonas eustigma]|eukprot:GAX83397.1 hypothetical protein CEUSTIGMA_g10822.t1 [Chlamydomonas eustigma]